MRGRFDVREIEDIGDAALSYNEVKALATGNPLLMEKAEADAELTRLERAERAHHRNQEALQHKVAQADQRIAVLTELIDNIGAQVSRHDFLLDNPLAGATPGSGQVASKPETQAPRTVRHVG